MTHAFIFGWGGSHPRQLAPYVELHRARGRSAHVYIHDAFGALVRFDRARARCADEAARLVEEARTSDLVVHSLSDNGFIAFCLVVAALRESDAGRRAIARIRAIILDSGPALWATTPTEFARRFAMATTPMVLGRRGPPHHPLVTPLLFAGFRAYTVLCRATMERVQGAYAAIAEDYPRCPHLFVNGEGDLITPRADIEAFARRLAARGASVRQRSFPTDVHTGALRAAPEAYRLAVEELLDACGVESLQR